ncbi:MAG: CIA30 family protein [Actinomycetota bacterium]
MTTTTAPPPATTAASAPVDTVDLGPAPGCRRLTDFDADLGDWLIVNDGVMGGRSEGFVDVDASVMRFDGTIVTAGGGFTSVRRRLDGGELSGTTRVEMRIRADDRRYAVILESDERVDGRSVSYRAQLDPLVIDDDGFAVVSAAYADMDTSIFGFRVEAAPFDAEAGREIGIIISDGIDGDFTLDVDWVDVCAD